jgi:hypothetical protein
VSAADENENENEERRMLLLIRERKREKKVKKKTSKKSKKDSRFFGSCVNCFVGVFCCKKKKQEQTTDTRKHKRCVVCSEFQRLFAKKAKKGEKRRKRISLPHNTFLE